MEMKTGCLISFSHYYLFFWINFLLFEKSNGDAYVTDFTDN